MVEEWNRGELGEEGLGRRVAAREGQECILDRSTRRNQHPTSGSLEGRLFLFEARS